MEQIAAWLREYGLSLLDLHGSAGVEKNWAGAEEYRRRAGVELVDVLLNAYPSDFLGLCYDSGHGNFGDAGLSELASVKDRLISIHLHDNSGTGDDHRLPFSGTVDWPRFVTILSSSAYTKCISLESTMGKEGIAGEEDFLAKAFAAGSRLSSMVAGIRGGHHNTSQKGVAGSV